MAVPYTPDEKNPAELAKDMERGSALVVFTPDQEVKSDKMHGVTRTKDGDGFWIVDIKMHDGSIEHWKQTDSHLQANDGFKYAAFKRLTDDRKTFLTDRNGDTQAMLVLPGSTANLKDLATFKEITSGGKDQFPADLSTAGSNMDYIIGRDTPQAASQYHAIELQRSQAEGHQLPKLTVFTHSGGVMSVGMGEDLAKVGWPRDSIHTINFEPVGGGTAIKRKAYLELVPKDPNTGLPLTDPKLQPTKEQIAHKIDEMSTNMDSVRTPAGLLHVQGGQWERANDMPGRTWQVDSGGRLDYQISDHEAATIKNVVNAKGTSAIHRTKHKDVSGYQFANDKPLDRSIQAMTNHKADAFILLGPLKRKGPKDAYDVDKHTQPESPVPQVKLHPSHSARPSYVDIKKPIVIGAVSPQPESSKPPIIHVVTAKPVDTKKKAAPVKPTDKRFHSPVN